MLTYISNILNHDIIDSIKTLTIEKMYGFYVKKNTDNVGDYSICDYVELGQGDAHSVSPDTISYIKMKEIYEETQADAIVIMHNHPKLKGFQSSVSPSDEDLIGTYAIARTCTSNKINLLDHIIIDATDYFSFVENEIIDL